MRSPPLSLSLVEEGCLCAIQRAFAHTLASKFIRLIHFLLLLSHPLASKFGILVALLRASQTHFRGGMMVAVVLACSLLAPRPDLPSCATRGCSLGRLGGGNPWAQLGHTQGCRCEGAACPRAWDGRNNELFIMEHNEVWNLQREDESAATCAAIRRDTATVC